MKAADKSAMVPIGRRHFLRRTLASAAAISVFPATLLGAEPTVGGAGQRVRLGVVGCGGRGAWIARLFQQHGGYELFAVADYFQAVVDQCGDALGVPQGRRFSGLSGYRRLMDSGVEAVALETPPYFFPEHVEAAVDRKLHVYMAKPVAVDVPGTRRVESAAARATASARVFLVDYQLPTEPDNIHVVDLVRAGEIGEVVALNSHYFADTFSDPPLTENLESRLRHLIWCNDVAVGGGYHVNACIHAVDAALWVARVRPVAAVGLSRRARPNPHGDSHDVFELSFEFDNGLLMSHRGKHLANQLGFDVVCQVLGTTGYAQICYGGKTMLRGSGARLEREVENPYEAGAVRNIRTFHEAITQRLFANETVRRSIDGALATILGREAGLRRDRVTLSEMLKADRVLEVDLTGLKA